LEYHLVYQLTDYLEWKKVWKMVALLVLHLALMTADWKESNLVEWKDVHLVDLMADSMVQWKVVLLVGWRVVLMVEMMVD